MNWKKIFGNIVGVAAVAYGGAVQAGAGTKQAILVVVGALLSNLAGLFQQHPNVS